MDIKRVGVIGCGLMGSGIAQVAAVAGKSVVIHEVESTFLDKGMERIRGSLTKLADKGKIEPSLKDRALGLLEGSLDLQALASCDLVIEAATEDLSLKKDLFRRLGDICKDETIFASNTSSFPIEEMGEASGRPQRMVGLHFFNPPALMKLVEVIRTAHTSDEVFEACDRFASECGKKAVHAKDTPGFVVNRLLVPYILEAVRMIERGDATKQDIDSGMKLGCGHPMGPLMLLDYVGLDTTLSIVSGWHERFPENPLFEPPALLKSMVEKGELGRKSGRGFYQWEGDKPV